MGECAAGHMTADNFWLADEIQSLFKMIIIKLYDHITWDEYPVHGQIYCLEWAKQLWRKIIKFLIIRKEFNQLAEKFMGIRQQ